MRACWWLGGMILLMWGCVNVCAAEADAPRQWHLLNGNSYQATFTEYRAGLVHLKRTSDGKELLVDPDLLSPADRTYVRRRTNGLQEPPPPPVPTATPEFPRPPVVVSPIKGWRPGVERVPQPTAPPPAYYPPPVAPSVPVSTDPTALPVAAPAGSVGDDGLAAWGDRPLPSPTALPVGVVDGSDSTTTRSDGFNALTLFDVSIGQMREHAWLALLEVGLLVAELAISLFMMGSLIRGGNWPVCVLPVVAGPAGGLFAAVLQWKELGGAFLMQCAVTVLFAICAWQMHVQVHGA